MTLESINLGQHLGWVPLMLLTFQSRIPLMCRCNEIPLGQLQACPQGGVTPHQVAEILSLKATYVHELCRTGRLPAMKSGTYWMIPVVGLRQWLVYRKRDVDGSAQLAVESRDSCGDSKSIHLTGPAGRPRGAPVS